MRIINLLIGSLFILSACNEKQEQAQKVTSTKLSEEFKDYWYAGKAEIASYNLSQVRYGEVHEGKAVLIFVTEDFSKEKHVKLDYPSKAGDDKINVMKLNFTKIFNTGIYPYSMMMSVFSPVDLNNNPRPLKINMSVQEWCGQVFTQLNLKNEKYYVHQYSYFESEGDQEFSVDSGFLTEDEIWNKIKIDYKSLPTGNIQVLPGILNNRFSHKELKPVEANCTLDISSSDTATYTIDYKKSYLLQISFKKEFPHIIYGWKEDNTIKGEKLTTEAILSDTLYTDYWTKNKTQYSYLRDSLGLDK